MSPRTARLLMRLEPELEGRILLAAQRAGETKTAWVERAIKMRLGEAAPVGNGERGAKASAHDGSAAVADSPGRPSPEPSPGGAFEFDFGGCLLTDRGPYDEIQALIGGEAQYRGRPGIVEAIWLIRGTTPWPGAPWPRPVYRIRWRPQEEES